MPAVRGKNLRSGDLAENLGLLILQSVALVAPVPRTEDVGVDAVVTLLRDFDARRYLAEDSCFVQIKSASVTSIEFESEETSWLFALDLPLFFAFVNRHEGKLRLYCAHRLGDAFISNSKREKVTIILDEPKGEFVEQTDSEIHVGPPVLEWSLNDSEFGALFFEVMKAHITIAKQNLATRRIGYIRPVAWKTNMLPTSGGAIISGRPSNDIGDAIAPYLTTWLVQLTLEGWSADAESLFKLLQKKRPENYISQSHEFFEKPNDAL